MVESWYWIAVDDELQVDRTLKQMYEEDKQNKRVILCFQYWCVYNFPSRLVIIFRYSYWIMLHIFFGKVCLTEDTHRKYSICKQEKQLCISDKWKSAHTEYV